MEERVGGREVGHEGAWGTPKAPAATPLAKILDPPQSLQSPRASGCCVYRRRCSAAARAVVATCCDTISGTWKAGRYDIFGSLFLIFR